MRLFKLKSSIGILALGIFSFFVTPQNTQAQQRDNKKATAVSKKNKKNSKSLAKVQSSKAKYKRGTYVTRLPRKAEIISYRNNKHHYSNGVFYRPDNGRYIVSAAPIGIRVRTIGPKPYNFHHEGRQYYYSYGTYYYQTPDNSYEVVSPPIGSRIDFLPEEYEVIKLDRTVYFKVDATYYKEVFGKNGSIVYEVVQV